MADSGVPIYDWSALAQVLKKSGLSTADINKLFSPELGALTGTYTEAADQGQFDQQLSWMENAPNLMRVLTLPDNDIRKIIAAEIQRGTAPWDVKRMVEEYTAKQAELNPGIYNAEGETKDLLSFVDTIDSEVRKKQVSDLKATRTAAQDQFTKAGLPQPGARFTAQELAPQLFDMLSKSAAATAARGQRASESAKQYSSALKFLEDQQKQQAQVSGKQARFEPTPPTGGEGLLASLSRNLANTPMGRGEAGVRGLIPLYKLFEQVPAGAAALYRGVTDPLYDEALRNIKYVAEDTLGREIKAASNADVLGQVLYGRPRTQIAAEKAVGEPAGSEAEMRRFGRVAERIVANPMDVKAKAAEASRLSRQSRLMDEAKQMLASLVEQTAASRGVTPLMQALAARANFVAAGGK